MFVKSAKFKQLIKEAYSAAGLKLGNDGTGIIIAGSYWAIWVNRDYIPKKVLAIIVELNGEIPEQGEFYISNKYGKQYEFDYSDVYRVMEQEIKKELEITNLLIGHRSGAKTRVLQEPKERKIILISERFIEMIDSMAVLQDDGEAFPEGPTLTNYGGIAWKNNVMMLVAYPITDERTGTLIQYLENIRINEKEKENE